MRDKPTDNGTPACDVDRFMLGARGKNPHDVLGDVTRADLPRNIILAAAVAFAFLVLLTVGPYVYKRAMARSDNHAAPEPGPAAKAEPVKKETPKDIGKTIPGPLAVQKPKGVDPLPKGVDPLNKLGVSESKTTDPKKNPLDKSADDLLKDIK